MTGISLTRRSPRLSHLFRRASVVAVVGAVGLAIAMPAASADGSSDSRATFYDGNATACSAVHLGSDTQVGSDSNSNASDSNLSGVVKTNAGSVHPGQGDELDVSVTGSNVIIDAVVVKGGNGYNVYSNQTYLPPQLQPDQHYISPLNGGGNVPTISHWFICYRTSGGGVPLTSVGMIGGTGLVAIGLAFATLRSHRRRPASSVA